MKESSGPSIATRTWLLWSLLVLLAGGCESADDLPLQIEPSTIRHNRAVIAGQPITEEFKLINPNDSPIRIVGTRTGCGCTSIIVNDQIVEDGTLVELGSGMHLGKVVVDTQMKGGESEFVFQILYDCSASNKPKAATGSLEAVVCRGFVARPAQLTIMADDTSMPAWVDILDDLPGPYEIERIEVSDPDTVKASIPNKDREASSETNGPSYLAHFQVRRQLEISIERGASLSARSKRHWVRVYTNQRDVPPIELPIHIITPTPLTVIPAHIVVPNDSKKSWDRTVRVRSTENWVAVPRVSFPADLCEVVVKTTDDPHEVTAKITISARAKSRKFVIDFETSDGQHAKLPVSVGDLE